LHIRFPGEDCFEEFMGAPPVDEIKKQLIFPHIRFPGDDCFEEFIGGPPVEDLQQTTHHFITNVSPDA
jgi:hypothetical protein